MNKIDCLFITSTKEKSLQFSVYPYLGVGYLAAFLKKNNLSSAIYDTEIEKGKINKLIQLIRNKNPIIIGYSMMSIALPMFYRLTKVLRAHFPHIIIVAGGPHVTSAPEVIFEMGLDYGFRGYAENSFPKFIKLIKNNENNFSEIEGIVINKSRTISPPAFYNIADTDVMPEYNLYNIKRYQNIFYGRRWFTMITTRGCAFNCKFCKEPGMEKYREYPLILIQNQIKKLVVDFGLKWISFVDDSFTYNRKRIFELCHFIINENLKFKWTCCTRVDLLDEEMILLMRKAGLCFVIIGVEAGNEQVRKSINKNITNEEYINKINILKKAGVRVLCSYVLGNPAESYKQIQETIDFAKSLKADYAQFYNMTALPQSPIFLKGVEDQCVEFDAWNGYMRGERDIPYYIPASLDLRKLKYMRKRAFLMYYLRPNKFIDLGARLIKFFISW